MAKININFNNTNYFIDESLLAPAISDLSTHLSTVMNGTGEMIELDGTSYNIDSAKLSAARNAFVSHLGTIAGNGHKVVVDGVEYSVDSSKVADVISEIESFLGGTGEETVNEYGFYFDRAYVGNVSGMGETSLIFHENDAVDVYVEGNLYASTGAEYSEGTVNVPALGASGTVNSDGTEINVPSLGTTFVLQEDNTTNEHGLYLNKAYVNSNGEAFVFLEDGMAGYYINGVLYNGITMPVEYNGSNFYIPTLDVSGAVNSNGTEISFLGIDETYVLSDSYIYHGMEVSIGDYTYRCIVGGDDYKYWNVTVNDKTKSSYGTIKSEVKGVPVTKMADTFYECVNLTTAPEIPSSVTYMNRTFGDCTSLTTASAIPSSVTYMDIVFGNCTNLTGNVEINTDTKDFSQVFYNTVKPITITGSCSEATKAALAGTANNGNVTY